MTTISIEEPGDPITSLKPLGGNVPEMISPIGAGTLLLRRPLLAVLCSAKAPAGILLALQDLAQACRIRQETIISGFHSPAEKEVFNVMLRKPGITILRLARSLDSLQIKPEWRDPIREGRLLLVSALENGLTRPATSVAYHRNRFVAALADQVLITTAHPGSKTEDLADDILAWA